MKAISIKQPWASLIAHGIKTKYKNGYLNILGIFVLLNRNILLIKSNGNMKKKELLILANIMLLIGICLLYWVLDVKPFQASSICKVIPDLFLISYLVSVLYIILKEFCKRFPLIFILQISFSVAIVFVIYFYKFQEEADWILDNKLTLMEVIIAFVSSVVVIWGGYLALKQIKESVHTNKLASQTNKLSGFKMMIDILQDPQSRKNRETVYKLMIGNQIKPCSDWDNQQKDVAHKVLIDIDQIGLMIKYGLLDYDFIEGWSYAINKCLYILDEYKKEEEKKYYYYFMKNNKEKKSIYYLGINYLLELRDKNIIYDFEDSVK
jgi:heme/copper-type cytochrome/quinol oxidase subunit 4